MTNYNLNTLTPSSLGRCIGGFLLACCSLTLITPSISASESRGEGSTSQFPGHEPGLTGGVAGGSSSVPDLWGDDTIGALPIMGDAGGGSFLGGVITALDAIMLHSAPSIVLEGRIADLQRVIADADGGGSAPSYVFLESTTPGRARLFFQGQSKITLKRQAFNTGLVSVSLFTGLDRERNRVRLSDKNGVLSIFGMNGGVVNPMNLDMLLSRGLLDFQGLDLSIQSGPKFVVGEMTFAADSQFITLTQN